MAEAVTVTGEKELLRKFRKLHDFMDEGPIEAAALSAAKVIKNDARRNLRGHGIRTLTGGLEKSLRSERPKRKLKGFPGAFVMVGGRAEGLKTWLAWVIEFGHAVVRGGKVVSHAPAYPFFRRAIDSNRARTLGMIRRVAKREVARAARTKATR